MLGLDGRCARKGVAACGEERIDAEVLGCWLDNLAGEPDVRGAVRGFDAINSLMATGKSVIECDSAHGMDKCVSNEKATGRARVHHVVIAGGWASQ